jgi:flagellar basal-body rod protein FlgF
MDSSLYVVGDRMDGLAAQLQVIASNVANADSAGFKRMVSSFVTQDPTQPVEEDVMSPVWPELAGVALDTSQGPIRGTGRPLDLAVQGDAFFAVETPDGTFYTRKGRIYQTPTGELTDAAGNRFTGAGGSLHIPDGTTYVTVEKNGEIVADGQSVGQLALMDIPDHSALVPLGSGLYRNDGPAAQAAVTSTVVQGALEDSNVKPVSEMVALINVTRAYEAAARLLRQMGTMSDQLLKTAS